jgi:hypothetical protein
MANRRTKAEIEYEEEQIIKFLAEHGRNTARQVYYYLMSHNIVPNTKYSYNMVDGKINELRYEARIPFDSILDTTGFYGTTQWSSYEKLLDYNRSIYRSNWNEEFDTYVEVWVEKEALADLVSEVANRYGVFTSANGGISKVSQIHSFLKRVLRYGKPTIILYLGDFDPTGLHIDQVIRDQINKQTQIFPTVPEIAVRRIAVTEEQIATIPENYQQAKEKDPNYEEYVQRYGTRIWELEALTSEQLSDIIANVLEKYRPMPGIEELMERDMKEVEAC